MYDKINLMQKNETIFPSYFLNFQDELVGRGENTKYSNLSDLSILAVQVFVCL
jgi:hypothetical protein